MRRVTDTEAPGAWWGAAAPGVSPGHCWCLGSRSVPRRAVFLSRGPQSVDTCLSGGAASTGRGGKRKLHGSQERPPSLLATVRVRCRADSLRAGRSREAGLGLAVCPVVLEWR